MPSSVKPLGAFGGDERPPVAAVGEEEAEAVQLGAASVQHDLLLVVVRRFRMAFTGPELGDGGQVAALLGGQGRKAD
ncbi:hypothetical protein [Streptacidiphilus jiangxiensis]|uniref:hypothetical protein n=1 Tax=Streptacidiphilus jiangxiensis TaxID=235985 RepID=UPI00116082A5|nr:hypothetical protein [Streptacidiphilus jiangxiensis]